MTVIKPDSTPEANCEEVPGPLLWFCLWSCHVVHMTGRPISMSVCATSTLCAKLPKSSITLKCSEKMVQCTMRKTWYLSWQWVELIAAQMWTNLPGSKMQRCLCKPKCARQRACTTFFPCSVSMTDLNVCSSKKEREMNLKKCKHFVKSADTKAKRNYQSANWLDMKSSASQVCYEVWSITRSQFIPKKDQKKKMCSCTLSSQQELWVI